MMNGNGSDWEPVTTPGPQYLVGFSSKINDPAFAKYRRDSKRWSFLFSFILAAIALIAFPVYGNKTGEIDWPDSLFYGMGIGAMFILIAGLQALKRSLDKTWDGAVILKESRRKMGHIKNLIVSHMEYIIQIQKENGGVKKHKWVDTTVLFDYYNIGDKVRHHQGFFYYEKYDKSKDTEIMCAACNTFNDINLDACQRCQCPLLK